MPAPPLFGTDDYAQAMSRLAPRGSIWRSDSLSIFFRTLLALAPTYTRSTEAAAQLLVDTNPSTTVNLLTEWEQSLSLPDPCTVSTPSLIERQAAVRAKFAARGALTKDYFIALAATLGFTITIDEFTPFAADGACDLPDYDPGWAFAWRVNAPQITTFYFSADLSGAEDPLETWDNTELACRIRRDAPAETIVFFRFGSGTDFTTDFTTDLGAPDF